MTASVIAPVSPVDRRLPRHPVAAVMHAASEATLDDQFQAWLDANPTVLAMFIEYADKARASGRQRIGAKRITEVMRWDTRLPTTGDAFKINNNFVSRLARRAIQVRPDLAGLFEFRELRS